MFTPGRLGALASLLFVAACASSGSSLGEPDHGVRQGAPSALSKGSAAVVIGAMEKWYGFKTQRFGCSIVGFDVDNEGRPSSIKVFYSAPDQDFAEHEAEVLSSIRLPELAGMRHKVIAMQSLEPSTSAAASVACDFAGFKRASKQAVEEGYSSV